MDDNHKILLGTGDDLEIYHNGSNAYIKNGTGQLLYRSETHTFESAGGSEYARITSDGRLGIGEASPDAPLHISANSGGSQIRLRRGNSASNTNDYGRIYFESSSDVLTGEISVARESGEDNGYMHFKTA